MDIGGTPHLCGFFKMSFMFVLTVVDDALCCGWFMYVVSCIGVRRYGLALSIGSNSVGFYLKTETESSLRNVAF
jgi:hypothetical protein